MSTRGLTLLSSGHTTAYEQLKSHAFDRRLKVYTREAGLLKVHLSQFRHTFARFVSEEWGSITATQEALGHEV